MTAADLGGVALVVLGGRSGGVTAAEVAHALRAAGDPTPVVILTNGADPAAIALSDADAGVRVVAKPFTPAELGAAGAALVGRG